MKTQTVKIPSEAEFEEAWKRVENSVAWLDRKAAEGEPIPVDWREKLDLDTLDIRNPERCVLSQVIGKQQVTGEAGNYTVNGYAWAFDKYYPKGEFGAWSDMAFAGYSTVLNDAWVVWLITENH
jgi:hypothetical protein